MKRVTVFQEYVFLTSYLSFLVYFAPAVELYASVALSAAALLLIVRTIFEEE